MSHSIRLELTFGQWRVFTNHRVHPEQYYQQVLDVNPAKSIPNRARTQNERLNTKRDTIPYLADENLLSGQVCYATYINNCVFTYEYFTDHHIGLYEGGSIHNRSRYSALSYCTTKSIFTSSRRDETRRDRMTWDGLRWPEIEISQIEG